MTNTIHHATAKKFDALIAEFDAIATLKINLITGNPELVYDDRKFEAESAKELVEALRAELEGDDDYTGSHLEDLEIEGEQDEEDELPSSIVPPKYKAKYAKHHDSCGDELAEYLRGYLTSTDHVAVDTPKGPKTKTVHSLNIAAWHSVAVTNNVDSAKWTHLNNGQKRMNLGNCLRCKIRHGVDVIVGSKTFKGDAQT